VTLPEAQTYFTGHIDDLKRMSADGTPWVFLCGSALIDYLSKLADGRNDGGAAFKRFVNVYMPRGYLTFKYRSGLSDLPEQLYHVLRCGIVHSFSMIPDAQAKNKGGRDRSIVLSHHEPHLSPYSTANAPDACCLRADGFVADLEAAMKKLFTDAATNAQLAGNITAWLAQHPPIAGNV